MTSVLLAESLLLALMNQVSMLESPTWQGTETPIPVVHEELNPANY